jgi:hypothetical protein
MRASQVSLLCALAWQFPGLLAELDEHLADNDGEILPHPLMSTYERWAETALEAGDPSLDSFLEFLEDAYKHSGNDVEELISVSFLEHLPRPGEPGAELRTRVGPALARQLEVIG